MVPKGFCRAAKCRTAMATARGTNMRAAARDDAPPAIEIRSLVKEYPQPSGAPLRAVDGLSLSIPEGGFYGLLGPNGAGKTTVVRILATLLRADGGHAEVFGHDVLREADQVRRMIGLTGQFAAVDEVLTGRENLRMFGRLFRMSRREAAARGDELLERFDLLDAADRQARTYSGGMRRRLDLAASRVAEPAVLFLDEPTTGLDPQSRSALWAEVSRLARDEGVTVFLTTQYLEEADVLADRVGIIDRGKIVAEDTPEALKAEIGRPSVEATPAERSERDAVARVLREFGEEIPAQPGAVAVRLSSGAAGLADVVRALDRENIRVANLRLDEPSLDDVFLAKTGRSLEGAGEDEEGGMEEVHA
jgi:ABC-2 type transport system ATP-binding protein